MAKGKGKEKTVAPYIVRISQQKVLHTIDDRFDRYLIMTVVVKFHVKVLIDVRNKIFWRSSID